MWIWVLEYFVWIEFGPDLPSIFKQYFFEAIDRILHWFEGYFVNQNVLNTNKEFGIRFKNIEHE